MPTEIFTKEQFENALPQPYIHIGLEKGEETYTVEAGQFCKIIIRSSIKSNGLSASTGRDSIRMWLNVKRGYNYIPLGRKPALTQRLTGWEGRMETKLNELIAKGRMITSSVGNCSECDTPLFASLVRTGKNEGRAHAKCSNREHFNQSFTWLDAPIKSDNPEVEEEPVEVKEQKDNSLAMLEMAKNAPKDAPPTSTPVIKKDVQLDQYQQIIVDTLGQGQIVIEACPGSGKTRTIESLISQMILSGVDPDKIGAFTFSRQAASEMRGRIAQTVFEDITEDELEFFEDPYNNKNAQFNNDWVSDDPRRKFIVEWVCTIHALSLRLLKSHGFDLNVLSGKAKWETDNIIKDGLKELNWKESPKTISAYISSAILALVTPDKSRDYYRRLLNSVAPDLIYRASDLSELYSRYYSHCKKNNLVDFDMMVARVIWLLRNNPKFKEFAQDKFDYIIVDEAQDTDILQAEILWTMASNSKNIVMCGDVDQNMYSFRGAEPEVLRELFSQEWADVQRFNLPVNYRSTQEIVRDASKLISFNYQNDAQYLKPFQYRNDAPKGKKLSYIESDDFNGLTDEITSIIKQNSNFSNWFILSRTRAECAAIHIDLIKNNIPAVNKSGGLLFGNNHIKKVLAYARLGCDYQDAKDDLEILSEIANVASSNFKAPMTRRRHEKHCNVKPWVDCGCKIIIEKGIDYSHSRFYGKKAIQDAGNWEGILDQVDETNRGGYPTVRAKGAADLVEFVISIESKTENSQEAIAHIIENCVKPWLIAEEGLSDKDLSESGKDEDTGLLLNLCEDGQTLEQYLKKVDTLSRSASDETNKNSVSVGTFHWAKGSESKNVIINLTRCPIVPPKRQDGTLPVGKSNSLEEERRLAYVGVTRAKEECVLVGSLEWLGNDLSRSRFVSEMGVE